MVSSILEGICMQETPTEISKRWLQADISNKAFGLLLPLDITTSFVASVTNFHVNGDSFLNWKFGQLIGVFFSGERKRSRCGIKHAGTAKGTPNTRDLGVPTSERVNTHVKVLPRQTGIRAKWLSCIVKFDWACWACKGHAMHT